MDAAAIVAILGMTVGLLAAITTSYLQFRSGRGGQIREARIRAYLECAVSLYEWERILFNRSRTRLESSETDRTILRQEAHKAKSQAMAALAKLELLSQDRQVITQLIAAHDMIDDLVKPIDYSDLNRRHEEIHKLLRAIWPEARRDVTR